MRKLVEEKMPALLSILLIVIMVLFMVTAASNFGEQDMYREDVVKRGDLVVGVIGQGTVDMGTVSQVFDMDVSDLYSEDQEPEEELLIARVCASEGQRVQAGDVLYLLEEEAVSTLREELKYELEKADAQLKLVNASQEAEKQNAQYIYDSSMAYGSYAELEYNATIRELEAAVLEQSEKVASAKEILSTYQEQLSGIKTDYNTANTVLKNCERSRDRTNKSKNMSKYIEYYELAQAAQSNLDALSEKKEALEAKVEQAKQNVESYTKQMEIAKRNLEMGRLEAQETLELRNLAYDKAQEHYDFTMEYLEESAAKQQEAYDAVKNRWEQFCTLIDGNAVKAQRDGVIVQMCLAKGEALDADAELAVMYDWEDVSMTIAMDKAELADIAIGSAAQVVFKAYPDRVFRAVVSDMTGGEADSLSDGDANVTEEVTILLEGDTTELLQGMAGEIILITKEKADVIYVSNQAVSRLGLKSYVTVTDAEGNKQRCEVTTGFSDGVNVEIKQGLSEGDVVCYTIQEQDAERVEADKIKLVDGQQLVYGKVISVKGNEIIYETAPEKLVATTLPVGSMPDIVKLKAGDNIALVTVPVENGTAIIDVYLIQPEE